MRIIFSELRKTKQSYCTCCISRTCWIHST